mgnify:CR=1 FL=1
MTPHLAPHLVTGLVLAGGRGLRMGGVDKGLQEVLGKPLAWHVMRRLQAQCAQVSINANRNLVTYSTLGAPVWPDTVAEFAGPLAGFLTGLQQCNTPFLQTAPCDVPYFPSDLVQRLGQALTQQQAEMAIASSTELDPQGQVFEQRHPVFCLMHSSLRDSLSDFMAKGGRKIEDWLSLHHCVRVTWPNVSSDVPFFVNLNTPQDLSQLHNRLA